MGDIVDLSVLEGSIVRTVDFRVFASSWCGLNMGNTCYGGLCCTSVSRMGSSSSDFDQCRSLLSGLHGNIDRCTYAVQEDCRTTVWTYKQDEDGILDSFQPDKELQKKKKISFVRKRRDLYNTYGPGSEAETATVLAYGSLFSAPYRGSQLYIDIHESPRDSRIHSFIQKTEFLPFVPEIIRAGKEFAKNTIKEPFLCAQLRLLDGQFKNHWKMTFSALEQKIQSLQLEFKGLIHIFIMTDLPATNWTGTYLADLAKDKVSYKLYALQETDELIGRTAQRVMEAEHGLRSGFVSHGGINKKEDCEPVLLPDVLLYIEESVCSCGSLGFVETVGSTIAESIKSMRKHGICKL